VNNKMRYSVFNQIYKERLRRLRTKWPASKRD
jgi:hypothetical protein